MTTSKENFEDRIIRDLTGELPKICSEISLDIAEVLNYPLTAFPQSLCKANGERCQTQKNALLHILEDCINKKEGKKPNDIDIEIIDAYFVKITNFCDTILNLITESDAKTVIITFKQYFSPTINVSKRVNSYKRKLESLYLDWEKPERAESFKNKSVYINYKHCDKFVVFDDVIVRTREESYSCRAHEEAYTKMIFHACKAKRNSNVVIRCKDTNVLVIALANMQHLNENVELWLHFGTTDENKQFINVNKIYDSLGQNLCQALPAFHAFTGCDYNSSFYNKGKREPFKILKDNTEFIDAFSKLHKHSVIEKKIYKKLGKFVCMLYNRSGSSSVNEARHKIFSKKNTKKLSLVPPCKSELQQHIHRSAYISGIWCNAYKQNPTSLFPSDCGWHLIESKYELQWFEGELPDSFRAISINDLKKINGKEKLQEICSENKLNIDKILRHPLTPIPLSLCQANGKIWQTKETVLLDLIVDGINKKEEEKPKVIDVEIIDAYFIQGLPNPNISLRVLKLIEKCAANTVIITFDRCISPSIKDDEHSKRRGSKEGSASLKSDFKDTLEVLFEDWEKPKRAEFLKNKIVYIDYEHCEKFVVVNDVIVRTRVESYSCRAHEEADTKMIFHACKAEPNSNVVLRCNDTDVLVIALANMQYLNENVKLWLDFANGDHRRYINVNKIYDSLGKDLCQALSAFHAFTGCDYNSSFYGKSKNQAFKILEDGPEFIKAFSNLHNYPDIETSVYEALERFVCIMYNDCDSNQVNKARHKIFNKKKPKKLSHLPPCKSELEQHIRRSAYISSIWCNAYEQNPTSLSPSDCGWYLRENKYKLQWFEGDQWPDLVRALEVINSIG